jgi:hypothetical protein
MTDLRQNRPFSERVILESKMRFCIWNGNEGSELFPPAYGLMRVTFEVFMVLVKLSHLLYAFLMQFQQVSFDRAYIERGLEHKYINHC